MTYKAVVKLRDQEKEPDRINAPIAGCISGLFAFAILGSGIIYLLFASFFLKKIIIEIIGGLSRAISPVMYSSGISAGIDSLHRMIMDFHQIRKNNEHRLNE